MRSFDYEAQAESGALIGCDRVRRAQDGFREAGLRPTVIKLIELGLERVQSFDNAGGDVIMQLEGDGAATDLGVLLKDVAVAVPASLASRLTEFLAAQSGQPEQACHTRPLQRDRRNETMLRRLPGSETAGLQTFFLESALTFLIAAVLEDVRPRERAGKAGSSALGQERLKRVMDHIDANLAEPISLSDLAAVACISAYHFARNFKIEMGISPLAFVTQRRVERAKRLLQGSGLTLAQVAYDCGFANQSHFTTVFRKHTGQTPGAYRKGR